MSHSSVEVRAPEAKPRGGIEAALTSGTQLRGYMCSDCGAL